MMFLEECGVAKVVYLWCCPVSVWTKYVRLNHYILCTSPQSEPCLSMSGLSHPLNPPLLSYLMGNISHYNSSSRTGCHLGALCCVFVGLGSCFGESDREWTKGLFPSTVPSEERPGLSSLITVHWEGGQTLWVGWENIIWRCTIWICIKHIWWNIWK